MEYHTLGQTRLQALAIAFGCGPVSGWIAELRPDNQCAVAEWAIDLGIYWFDTALGYGDDKSEERL
jgi:aryl-alcohol dehydrogenase-like predicted oxidoreductase